jgi:hypothetical protein
LTAFVAAPFTTLSPLIGAGHVAALAQASAAPAACTRSAPSPRTSALRCVVAEPDAPDLARIYLDEPGASAGALFGGFELFRQAF